MELNYEFINSYSFFKNNFMKYHKYFKDENFNSEFSNEASRSELVELGSMDYAYCNYFRQSFDAQSADKHNINSSRKISQRKKSSDSL